MLLAIINFPIIQTYSQIWLSNEDIYSEAEEFLDANEHKEALPLYLLLEKKEIINSNIQYKIGECFLNIRGKKLNSLPYLELAAKNVSSDYTNSFTETRAPLRCLLLLGVAYRLNGEYDKAIETLKVLKDSISVTDDNFNQVVDMHIRRCQNARLFSKIESDVTFDNLNSSIDDQNIAYNPVEIADGLFYMNELKFYDAIMFSKKSSTGWDEPLNLTPKIGSDGDHIITDVSADGKHLLLYIYEPPIAGEIYESVFEDGKWTDLSPIKGDINSKYNETHASFSSDGQYIYFTSNRPGGSGGMDIYRASKSEDNTWTDVVNLGNKINTPFNEETPFISEDSKTLFFSSQGHLNVGGYDYFYSILDENNQWDDPVNLYFPITTTDNDLFYFPIKDGSKGLVSRSENSESGTYQIFRVNNVLRNNPAKYKISGLVYLPDSQALFESIKIELTDNAQQKQLDTSEVGTDGTFQYLLPTGEYTFAFKLDDNYQSQKDIVLNENSPLEANLLINQSDWSEILREKVVRHIDTIKLKYILFDFDSYTVQQKYYAFLNELSQFLINNPDIELVIIGHTDAIGTASYNLVLSDKRAKAVSEYIQRQGINENRITLLAKGEEMPVAKNENSDGSDNAIGRKYNRRVNFNILNEPPNIIIQTEDIISDELRTE